MADLGEIDLPNVHITPSIGCQKDHIAWLRADGGWNDTASHNRSCINAVVWRIRLTKLVMGEMAGCFEMILKKTPFISALSSVARRADN